MTTTLKTTSHITGDDWVAMATIMDDPFCGLYIVFKPDGRWELAGSCFRQHSHIAAMEQLINQRLKGVVGCLV